MREPFRVRILRRLERWMLERWRRLGRARRIPRHFADRSTPDLRSFDARYADARDARRRTR